MLHVHSSDLKSSGVPQGAQRKKHLTLVMEKAEGTRESLFVKAQGLVRLENLTPVESNVIWAGHGYDGGVLAFAAPIAVLPMLAEIGKQDSVGGRVALPG